MTELDQTVNLGSTAGDTPGASERQGFLSKLSLLLRANWRTKEQQAPFFFTASSLWLSVAQLLSGIVIVHYIDPRDMGLWASVNLALTYSVFLLAGVQNGLSRELPYYLGANDAKMAQRLAATTVFYTIGGCILALLGGVGVSAVLIWRHQESKLIFSAAAVTFLIICRFYQNYLFVTFRSKNSFWDLAKVQSGQGAAMLLFLPFLFLGYGGLLLRFTIVAGLATLWMHQTRPMRVSPFWKTDSFLILLRTGIPIFATDYITNCAGTLDRVALLRYGGLSQVGFYSVAISAYAAFAILPQSIAHYVYPRMSHHYGRTNDPRVLWTIAWQTTLIVVISMVPIAVLGSCLLPTAVRLVFPKYVQGTHAAQIAMFTAVAYGATIGSNALASLKAWSHLFTFQFSYAGLLAVGPFVGIRLFSAPLTGVAYGMFSANLLGAILALTITFAATHRIFREADFQGTRP